MVTREKLIETFEMEGEPQVLEPCEVLYKGILGTDDDKEILVYSWSEMVAAYAEYTKKQWEGWSSEERQKYGYTDEEPDYYSEAADFIDYNIMRYLGAMPAAGRPFVVLDGIEAIKDLEKEDESGN